MFQEFKNALFDQIVISNHQINLLFPDFIRSRFPVGG